METDTWIIKTIDMREPIERFIPEWCFMQGDDTNGI